MDKSKRIVELQQQGMGVVEARVQVEKEMAIEAVGEAKTIAELKRATMAALKKINQRGW